MFFSQVAFVGDGSSFLFLFFLLFYLFLHPSYTMSMGSNKWLQWCGYNMVHGSDQRSGWYWTKILDANVIAIQFIICTIPVASTVVDNSILTKSYKPKWNYTSSMHRLSRKTAKWQLRYFASSFIKDVNAKKHLAA